MPALLELLTTFTGLLSLGVIVFMLVMQAWLIVFFRRRMREDGEAAAKREAEGSHS